jgi:hypothetical protein
MQISSLHGSGALSEYLVLIGNSLAKVQYLKSLEKTGHHQPMPLRAA